MKAVVFAYHNMGLAGLRSLVRCGYEISTVFSHEDDPSENCWFGSVKKWAEEKGIPVLCPEKIAEPEWAEKIGRLKPDMIFSFYYRNMIPEAILGIPPMGAYNLHGSLLPAYRGRCPVNWVLIHGESRTGVTLHHMVKKADAGDIVGQRVVLIDSRETARSLYGKLCEAAEVLLGQLLPLMREGTAPRIPQDISRGSYYGGRRPEDGRIDWQWDARRIYNLIRAVTDPYPGAFGLLPDGSRMIVWWGEPGGADGGEGGAPGRIRIRDGKVWVGTGGGSLSLSDVQIGNERMTAEAVVRYFRDKEGQTLS
jgi:UDP-4-amino-4-deoxy-L-arabinose formyltransferase/UDP-glucuronic acid dehydrogenase (UDP-4-keto-hexauronic acid decarboxylating)